MTGSRAPVHFHDRRERLAGQHAPDVGQQLGRLGVQLKNAAADQVAGLDAGDFQSLSLRQRKHSALVHGEKHHWRIADDRVQPFFRFLEMGLGEEVAGGDDAQGLGFHVQPGQGQADRDSGAVALMAQEVLLWKWANLGPLECLAPMGPVCVDFGVKHFPQRHAQELFPAEAAQLLGHGVDVQDVLRVQIDQEQGIPCFLEEYLGQFSQAEGNP